MKIPRSRVNLLQYPSSTFMNMTHLFTTNASVDAHNNALYTLSKANKAQIKAVDIIVGDISDDLKKQMKNKSQMIQQRQWVCIC